MGLLQTLAQLLWGVCAAGTASLAMLQAYSALSSSHRPPELDLLRAGLEHPQSSLSLKCVSLRNEIAGGITTIFQCLPMGVFS